MYDRSARFYDAIYGWKDYEDEVRRLLALIDAYRGAPPASLLDVACGTGKHLSLLCGRVAHLEGVELNESMLTVARERLPDLPLHQGDMTGFDLGQRFDVVTCLFSAIAYAGTVEGLQKAARSMARHLNPGGLLMVEPFIFPDKWNDGQLHQLVVDQPDLKISRINLSRRQGRVAVLDMHYLVGTPEGVEHFVERHDLTLFTPQEYRSALEVANLAVAFDEYGLDGRGMFVGRPAD
ncbi:MAG: class I SAM-dependent methyltransferase [Chloroflexota bacterium]